MAQEIGIREVLQQVDARIGSLERHVEQRFVSFGNYIEQRFAVIEKRLDEVAQEQRELRREMVANFRWIVGIVLVSWVTLMGAIIGLSVTILSRLP